MHFDEVLVKTRKTSPDVKVNVFSKSSAFTSWEQTNLTTAR